MSDDPRPDDFPEDEQPLPAEMPSVDAADIRETRKRARTKKQQAREGEEFWVAVFSTPIGRRKMWQILEDLGTFEVRYGASPVGFPDERATWFSYGQHEAGRRLYDGWHMRMPTLVDLMRAENDPHLPDDVRKKVLKPNG